MAATLILCLVCSASFLPTVHCTSPVASASYTRPNTRAINPAIPPRGGDTCTNRPGDKPHQRPAVLIIDVDNTLYSEREAAVALPNRPGVEEQIIRNTHAFGLRHYNLTKEECDDLYRKYGSTVEGLRRTIPADHIGQTREMLRKFYSEVYENIDMSCLLSSRGNGQDGDSNTGYSHIDVASRKRRYIADFLKSVSCPIYFASNSPRGHVLKVLTALGLRDVKYEGIFTPDALEHDLNDGDEPYPTKSSPALFYKPILDKHSPGDNCVVLLDDSKLNLDKASQVGISGLHINTDFPLEEALAVSLRHIPSKLLPEDGAEGRSPTYEFSDVKYLRSKNAVDALSINNDVWQRLGEELSTRIVPSLTDGVLRIADVGAGLLSMLEMMMIGGGGKNGLFHMMQARDASFIEKIKQIHYYAYESNSNLIDGCRHTLSRLGFNEITEFCVGGKPQEIVFRGKVDACPIGVTVHLRTNDFREEESESLKTPNFVVGCCFADLFDPHELVQSLMRFTKLCRRGGGAKDGSRISSDILLYFPITFAGTTQFHPPCPFDVEKKTRSIPSDTCGFRLYANSLTRKLEHNLDPNRIISAMRDHGGHLLARGNSNWAIDPAKHPYLWETMLYFFGTSGAPEMMVRQWNAEGWISRARESRPSIVVSNTDLLFCLGAADGGGVSNPTHPEDVSAHLAAKTKQIVDEIQFVAPRRVGKISKQWNTAAGVHLGPNQVEVRAVSSLISSGTELKIFKGMFEEAALDINIKGMADASMAYPLSYGYSLVGRVTQCGADVADAAKILGRLVFTFSPHSSHVVVDRDAIQIVPEGISAEDAIFMPSVETALSLVHDAHVRVGEKVAVFGQGLIGLLVTSILRLSTTLSMNNSGQFGIVTAFDTISDRLAASSGMGASQALLPASASASGPFDVSIEVSGSARALQSAIDNTSSGGRVIVGSWYGNADVNLKLGIDFHRSHKTIKTSQVSEIPAELSKLWTKERRFDLTWELLRMIRPSRLITKKVYLDEAQEAYESLDSGKEIAVAFKYNP